MSDDSDDWKPGPAPSWDDLWNANSRLRAALAEAEREIERFREVCKGKTECLHDAYKQRDAARAALAEAERDAIRAMSEVRRVEARAERAEAELAASMVVRAELEHRLASQSDDKLRAENLRLTEELDRLRAALATENKLADQYQADYERSVLNGDRLFDEVERALAAAREALATSPCPAPARDGIYTVKDCIEIGDCGCDNLAALAKATWQGSGA